MLHFRHLLPRGGQLAKLFAPGKLQPAGSSESPHTDDEARLHKRKDRKDKSKYRSLANEKSDDGAAVAPPRGKTKKPKSKVADRDGGGFANMSFENQCSDEDETQVFVRCGSQGSDRFGSLRRTGNGLFSKLK